MGVGLHGKGNGEGVCEEKSDLVSRDVVSVMGRGCKYEVESGEEEKIMWEGDVELEREGEG